MVSKTEMGNGGMRVAVIGAGKMGLPLACQFAQMGANVTACDLRSSIVKAINRGECPIDEPGVEEVLANMVRQSRLSATTDTPEAVGQSEVIVIIVPVLLAKDHRADFSAIEAAIAEVAGRLRPGMMVSCETTVPVGTTRGHLRPILEQSGLKAGVDFDLVYSPERVKSQHVLQFLTKNPKVVGAITPQGLERGAEFYSRYLGAPVIRAQSLEAAELVKVAGMVHRDVNIALSNELARYAEHVGVDLTPVIQAANTDGETAMPCPGIGVGGHCTPVYPYFLIRNAEERGVPMQLAERSRLVNDGQARWAVERLQHALGSLANKRVLILGLAFRPGVKEHLMSPAFLLQNELRNRGADVYLHDPLYSAQEIRGHGFQPSDLDNREGFEVLVLNTAHLEYANFKWAELAARGTKAVVDGRCQWSSDAVRAAGLLYLGIGRPGDKNEAPVPSVPITRPVLGVEEAVAASDVIRSGWVAQGKQVSSFELEFAAYVGATYACAVSSCTTALHLALLAAGVQPGDEVITLSHSFVATANSVRYCGARPVFIDIEPATFNIDTCKIESAVGRRTRAILCVHQMGMPCDLKSVLGIARKHGLTVIEDAACAIGSELLWEGEWSRIGKPHGDVACFSFHPRKLITTGDGGMLTTSNPEWDRKFRLWRQHGMNIPHAVPYQTNQVVIESYSETGFNYRMTDIQAAVGREQLKRLPEMIERRHFLAQRYCDLLLQIPGLGLPHEPKWARSNWQSYCVRLPDELDQRRVMQAMLDSGVTTRRGIMCAHREPAYSRDIWSCGDATCNRSIGSCPHLKASEQAQDHCIVLPLFHQMSEIQQDKVVEALRDAVGQSYGWEKELEVSR
jgi:perosamine synthetase